MIVAQNRYVTLQNHLFSIFASSAWISEQLKIVPKGYMGSVPAVEYIEFNPVVSGARDKDSLGGVLYINIFTDLIAGPKRAAEIADILDKYLAGKSFKYPGTPTKPGTGEEGVTQFLRQTNFQIRGASPDNKAFLLSHYQIQFGFFRKES
jgi:hypothetical protein